MIMAANQYGVNVGDIYRDIESIKGARNNNKLAQMKIRQDEEAQKQRPVVAELRGKAIGGDVDAQQKLLAIDPKAGELIKAINSMDENRREKVAEQADQVGQAFGAILQSKDPERMYLLYRDSLPEEQAIEMPKNYDEGFLRYEMSKLVPVVDMLKMQAKAKVDNAKANKPSGQSATLAATEKNRSYKRVETVIASMAGAKFGPNNEYIMPGKNAAQWAQVQDTALKLMKANPSMSEPEAAVRAAIESGLVPKGQWRELKAMVDNKVEEEVPEDVQNVMNKYPETN